MASPDTANMGNKIKEETEAMETKEDDDDVDSLFEDPSDEEEQSVAERLAEACKQKWRNQIERTSLMKCVSNQTTLIERLNRAMNLQGEKLKNDLTTNLGPQETNLLTPIKVSWASTIALPHRRTWTLIPEYSFYNRTELKPVSSAKFGEDDWDSFIKVIGELGYHLAFQAVEDGLVGGFATYTIDPLDNPCLDPQSIMAVPLASILHTNPSHTIGSIVDIATRHYEEAFSENSLNANHPDLSQHVDYDAIYADLGLRSAIQQAVCSLSTSLYSQGQAGLSELDINLGTVVTPTTIADAPWMAYAGWMISKNGEILDTSFSYRSHSTSSHTIAPLVHSSNGLASITWTI